MLEKFGKFGRISALSLSSTLGACRGKILQNNLINSVRVVSARCLDFKVEVAYLTGNRRAFRLR